MNKYSQKRKRKSSLKIYIFAGLFFCLLAGLAYLLIWWPNLWVSDIEVEREDLKEIAWSEIEFPYKNIFLVKTDEIKQKILDQYPEIKDVQITRQFPDILKIKIEERKNIGVWCQVEEEGIATSTKRIINKCFYFDSEGIIFREALLIKGSLVLNIYGTEKSVKIRDEVISPEVIEFILTVRDGWPEVSDFEVISFEDLRATTNHGWQIYFNQTNSVETQLEALRTIFDKKVEPSEIMEYVDLRIKGRVYYR